MNIDIELSEESIENAIRQIEDYEQKLHEKTSDFVKEVAKDVQTSAAAVLAQHVWTGQTLASLHVRDYKDSKYQSTSVVKVGGAAVWLEFGTGVVTNNSSVGGYVHPMGAQLGVCGLGTYGQGHGADPNFHGIPATLFMWNSAQSAKRNIEGLARRIWR